MPVHGQRSRIVERPGKHQSRGVANILVTGAGGTVGGALARELEASGIDAKLGFRDREKLERARAAGKKAVPIDYDDRSTLAPALEGVERVFLLGTGRGQVERETAVVDAAVRAGVRGIVKLSVWEAAGEAYSFAKIHRPIERAIEASGLAWTFLRPNGFMQSFLNHQAKSIRTRGMFEQPERQAPISQIDARDIARVAAAALTSGAHEGRAYELSGPSAFTYEEAAGVLSRVLGRTIEYVPITDEAARAGMLASGMPEYYVEFLMDLTRHYRKGGAGIVTSAVRDVTGRDPTSFETFVRDHADALR
jgi:uncharacterized protein YbjT (DUF2867 family)